MSVPAGWHQLPSDHGNIDSVLLLDSRRAAGKINLLDAQTPVSDENPPSEDNAEVQRQKICDDEFARYLKHREAIDKAETEAEKNYDTLLITLATLGIGSTFTILKDITKGSGVALVVLSWIWLGTCVFSALVDRLLTYTTHKNWRLAFDDEFSNWSEGAWKRGLAAYDGLRGIKWLPRLKWLSFWSLAAGVIFLMLAVLVGWHIQESPTPTPSVIFNNYAATTQPTTKS